jgi:hypothetical protein
VVISLFSNFAKSTDQFARLGIGTNRGLDQGEDAGFDSLGEAAR